MSFTPGSLNKNDENDLTTLPFISRAESQTPRYLKIMKGIFMFKGAGDISFFFPFCIVIIPLFAHIALCLTLVLHSAVLFIIGCPMQAEKTGEKCTPVSCFAEPPS